MYRVVNLSFEELRLGDNWRVKGLSYLMLYTSELIKLINIYKYVFLKTNTNLSKKKKQQQRNRSYTQVFITALLIAKT